MLVNVRRINKKLTKPFPSAVPINLKLTQWFLTTFFFFFQVLIEGFKKSFKIQLVRVGMQRCNQLFSLLARRPLREMEHMQQCLQ